MIEMVGLNFSSWEIGSTS